MSAKRNTKCLGTLTLKAVFLLCSGDPYEAVTEKNELEPREWTESFPYKRVVVPGGAGFLGRFIVARLRAQPGLEVFAPRSVDYNLVDATDIKRLYADTQPDLVIPLAAVVGGIGANQKNPGRFFYENLMMGVQLIEQARLNNVNKFVALGTVCAYPKFTPTPFSEDDLWNG